MAESICVAIAGDYAPGNPTHTATEEALRHAGASLGIPVVSEWLPTDTLEGRASEVLRDFGLVFCSPGSPYRSLDGALEAIRFARENSLPFIGTCGGFQHAVIEYARNALGLSDAGHAEYDPGTPNPFVSALSCSPFGQTMRVKMSHGSKIRAIYGAPEAQEEYRCNYGVGPKSRKILETGGLRVSGTDPDGEARIIELPDHPFYVATLFVPQMGSSPGSPHPLICAFVAAGVGAGEKGSPNNARCFGAARRP